jgi:hypothetical protein
MFPDAPKNAVSDAPKSTGASRPPRLETDALFPTPSSSTSRQTESRGRAPVGPVRPPRHDHASRGTRDRRPRAPWTGRGRHDSYRPSLGFLPLRRLKTGAAPCAGVACPDDVRLQVFSTS